MNQADLLSMMRTTFSRLQNLEATKGKEYTDGSGDRLENFKGEAKNIGITDLQIWSVYASKHFRAIQSYIRHDGKVFSNEHISGRIDDLHVYLFLLEALIQDREIAASARSGVPVTRSKIEQNFIPETYTNKD